MIIPSPLLLLSFTTLLFFTFLFTSTTLPSLLLFGYRQVIIGVVIDKLIKLPSLLRTLKFKQVTVSSFLPGEVWLECYGLERGLILLSGKQRMFYQVTEKCLVRPIF